MCDTLKLTSLSWIEFYGSDMDTGSPSTSESMLLTQLVCSQLKMKTVILIGSML